MRIFISWSGELSYTAAALFSKWFPSVIQPVTIIVSAVEDNKGNAWFKKLMYQVSRTDYAIICLSPDNLNSPWLLFEAGAIANRLDQSKVCKLLIGDLTEKDINPPFLNFKSTVLKDKEDMRKLVQKINQMHETRILSSNTLNHRFEGGWQKLEDYCNTAIKKMENREKIIKPKTDYHLLKEINGLCHDLVEIMDATSNKIEHINNDFPFQNIVTFPKKEVRKA